jgi:peptidyl-prolyl cis-trans isomerase D
MINANDFKPQVNISDADIDKYYRLHSEEFKTPLRVKIEYIPFEYNNYKKDASVSPEEIDKYYQAHKKDYEKELSDAKEKGTAQPDAMAKVQERIRVTLIDKKAKEMADEASSDASYELMQAQHPDFYGIAKKFNLAVKESNFFAMSEPITDIGFSYEVAFEAFKLEPGQISSPIKAQSGRYIIKLKDKKEPYVPPLDEVQKQVKDIVTAEEAKKLADKKAQEMLALIEQKMRQGGTFKKACAELKLKAASTGLFTKEGYIPQLGESKEFAELAFGQRPGRLAGAAKTSQGSAIIFVTKKLKADEEKFEKEKSEFRKTALQEKETKYFTTWFEDLKKKANIKVSTEASNRKSQSTSSSQGPYAPLPLDDF